MSVAGYKASKMHQREGHHIQSLCKLAPECHNCLHLKKRSTPPHVGRLTVQSHCTEICYSEMGSKGKSVAPCKGTVYPSDLGTSYSDLHLRHRKFQLSKLKHGSNILPNPPLIPFRSRNRRQCVHGGLSDERGRLQNENCKMQKLAPPIPNCNIQLRCNLLWENFWASTAL